MAPSTLAGKGKHDRIHRVARQHGDTRPIAAHSEHIAQEAGAAGDPRIELGIGELPVGSDFEQSRTVRCDADAR